MIPEDINDTVGGILAAFAPPTLAAALAVTAVESLRMAGALDGLNLILRLLLSALIVGLIHLAVFRGLFSRWLRELLDVAPLGAMMARCLIL